MKFLVLICTLTVAFAAPRFERATGADSLKAGCYYVKNGEWPEVKFAVLANDPFFSSSDETLKRRCAYLYTDIETIYRPSDHPTVRDNTEDASDKSVEDSGDKVFNLDDKFVEEFGLNEIIDLVDDFDVNIDTNDESVDGDETAVDNEDVSDEDDETEIDEDVESEKVEDDEIEIENRDDTEEVDESVDVHSEVVDVVTLDEDIEDEIESRENFEDDDEEIDEEIDESVDVHSEVVDVVTLDEDIGEEIESLENVEDIDEELDESVDVHSEVVDTFTVHDETEE